MSKLSEVTAMAPLAAAPVVAAEVFEIEAGLVTPYKLSSGTQATTRAVMVKLTDADVAETDFSTFVRDGIVHLPTGAGLGVQVDEAHVRRLAVDSVCLGAKT